MRHSPLQILGIPSWQNFSFFHWDFIIWRSSLILRSLSGFILVCTITWEVWVRSEWFIRTGTLIWILLRITFNAFKSIIYTIITIFLHGELQAFYLLFDLPILPNNLFVRSILFFDCDLWKIVALEREPHIWTVFGQRVSSFFTLLLFGKIFSYLCIL